MAIINGSALGQFKNKFGNAVTAKWLDKNVARIYQPDVRNPQSESQTQVRARFYGLSKLAKSMRPALLTGMLGNARDNSNTTYGRFIQLNWEAVDAASYDDITVNYSELKVSMGSGISPVPGTPDWGTTTHLTIVVPFTYSILEDITSSADEIYMVLYCPDRDETYMSRPALVSAEEVEYAAPSTWNGMQAYAWLFSVCHVPALEGAVSPSIYVGHGEIV